MEVMSSQSETAVLQPLLDQGTVDAERPQRPLQEAMMVMTATKSSLSVVLVDWLVGKASLLAKEDVNFVKMFVRRTERGQGARCRQPDEWLDVIIGAIQGSANNDQEH